MGCLEMSKELQVTIDGTATDVSAILVDTATTIPALIETQSQIVERTAATGGISINRFYI